jgi:hypothetical protein
MLWKRACDRPTPKGGARSGILLSVVALLSVLTTQASRAQEAPPAGSGGPDAGPIDTSIAVQSSRATKSPHAIDSAKTKSGIGAQLPRQQASPNPGDRATPNAVGFPVARRGPTQATLPAQPGTTNPAGPATNAGVAAGGNTFAHPAAGGPTTTVNRAAISGTGMTRLGTGPGLVRGTPKSLGTISGSALHPKQ